jgi:hypothetical protein
MTGTDASHPACPNPFPVVREAFPMATCFDYLYYSKPQYGFIAQT